MRVLSRQPVVGDIVHQGKTYRIRPGWAALEAFRRGVETYLVVPIPLLARLSLPHIGAGLAVTLREALRQGFVAEVQGEAHSNLDGSPPSTGTAGPGGGNA